MSADPGELAERMRHRAEARAERAVTLGVPWALALLVLWQGAIEPLVPRIQRLISVSHQFVDRREQFRSFRAKPAENPQQRDERLSRLRGDLSLAESEYHAAVNEAEVAFSMPGLAGEGRPGVVRPIRRAIDLPFTKPQRDSRAGGLGRAPSAAIGKAGVP